MTRTQPRARLSLAGLLVGALTLSLLALAPPAPASAAEHWTDFSGYTVGEQPADWTSRWEPAWFAVADNPSRLVQSPTQGARTLLTWDAPGDITGQDVEIATVVQVPEMNFASSFSGARFQLHINATGEAGSETSYFLDQTGDNLRLGEFRDGEQEVPLASTDFNQDPDDPADDFEFERYTWYNVVFGRDGHTLRAKIWGFGTEEPEGWHLEHTPADPLPLTGHVGVGSRNAGTNPGYSDFAFFSVGTGNDAAPRPPGDLVEVADVPATAVPGVSVEQNYGFTTVRWEPVTDTPALQTEYHIYRVPVDENNQWLEQEPTRTGVWRPNRYAYTDTEFTFADAGYKVGERYGWTVQARTPAGHGPVEGWVYDTTVLPPSPGPEFRTAFENRLVDDDEADEADWTHYEEELAFNRKITANSDRVRLETIGESHLGRDIFLWTISDDPPASPEENDKPVVLINCLVHGPEPSGREACLMLIRELAFSDSEWVTDILETSTVLIVPVINRDGTHRRPQQRGNLFGQDLNRDHSLLKHPETLALSKVLRDWEPGIAIDGHHFGSSDVGDLPLLWSRSYQAEENLADFTQDHFILGHLFENAADAGWWPQPYPIGYSEETILRNTLGIKNVVGVLLESRSGGGATRPAENTQEANRARHAYSHLWTYRELLEYNDEHHEAINEVVENAKEYHRTTDDPLILHGARSTPRYSPPDRAIHPTTIIEDPPCGYMISDEQYTERPYYEDEEYGRMPSVETRLAAHGIEVVEMDDGVYVPLSQALRGLVALLLDPAAPGQTDEDVVGSYSGPFLYSGDAVRVQECPDLPTDPEVPTDPEPVTVRLSGAGRVDTAIDISQETYEDGAAGAVVLARADAYPDALAGTPLAAAVDAPLLITSSDELLASVATEIERVLPSGGTVHVLGGEGALSADVADQVDALGYEVDRIEGASRIETSVAIAERLTSDDDEQPLLLTTGYNYPDALTAGAAAAANGGIVLLTVGDDAHPAVDAYIDDRDDAQVHAVGGPATRAYPNAHAVSGATRDHTAVEVAEAFFDAPEVVAFARNDDYPDALAGGAFIGRRGGPLLLTQTTTLSAPAAAYLSANTDTLASAYLFGGTAAISNGVAMEIEELIGD